MVTGAGRGIGQAIATALARAGARVALASRTTEELDHTAHSIEQAVGHMPLVVPTDVGDAAQVEALFDTVGSEIGDPSVLVNCAGQLLQRPLVDTTDAEWSEILTTNLTSAFYCCRAFGRSSLAAGRKGCVVTVSSVFGQVGVASFAAYSATKAALDGLTRALAVEWARSGVRVNSVAPGHLHTAMTETLLATEATTRHLLGRIPAGRLVTPAEVADLVVYLVSPSAEMITGQTIVLDGGYTIR